MRVKPDGLERAGFALQHMASRQILLSDICATEREAMAVRQAMNEHQPRRGAHRIVPVLVTVTLVSD